MRGVAAVVTTGIYCRPGCGAKPQARNVRWFPVAAAAETAGYRACLRCRPYRHQQVPDNGQPELVCRAVQLVLRGLLDHGTEIDLADRLGVSARHLRRLFTTHLGVTPDGLARSARAHLARRLLDETDLTVTEVAFAAGFGSLRQFDRVCRVIFRAPPSDLRAKRRRSDRLVADGGLALRLTFDGPLDWAVILAGLADTAVPGVEQVTDGAYRRTIEVGGDPGVLELTHGGPNHLVLRVHLPHWEELLHLVHRARVIASLDLAVGDATGRFVDDLIIGPLVRDRPGVRPSGAWDAYEAGVRAIVARGRAKATADGLVGRLVERHGRPVPGLGELGLTHLFPPPAALAAAPLDTLGLTPERAATVRAFATAVASGRVHLDRRVPLDQLIAEIRALPGVGSLTAHYIALRAGEPDAFPLSDSQLRRYHTVAADQPLPVSCTVLAAQWRPWRALAVSQMWAAAGLSTVPVQTKGAA